MTSPAPSPSPVRPTIPVEIRVLIGAAFVIAIGFGIIAPLLPQYASSFGVSVTAASVIVSVFAFTRLLFAPLSGRFTDRLGEPVVYVGGVLIVAVSTILVGLAGSYEQLLVYRALGGIGSTMFTVSAMSLIARLAPPEIRGRISGLYATAFLLGSIAGPVVGGLLAGFGYRLPFFLYGGALVVAAAIVHFSLARVRRRAALSSAGAEDEGPAPAPVPALTVREALDSPVYRAALVSGFANGWTNFGVRVAILPLFVAHVFTQHSAELAGLSLAVFAAGNAAVLTFSGRVTDRYGRRGPVIVGLAVGSVAMGAMGFTESVAALLALSVVAGMGIGFMNPAQQAAVADVVGQGRSGGKVLAGFQMATDLGAIIGPVLAGWLADLWGYQWSFGVAGAVGLVGVTAWLLVPARPASPEPPRTAPAADSRPGARRRPGLDQRGSRRSAPGAD